MAKMAKVKRAQKNDPKTGRFTKVANLRKHARKLTDIELLIIDNRRLAIEIGLQYFNENHDEHSDIDRQISVRLDIFSQQLGEFIEEEYPDMPEEVKQFYNFWLLRMSEPLGHNRGLFKIR